MGRKPIKRKAKRKPLTTRTNEEYAVRVQIRESVLTDPACDLFSETVRLAAEALDARIIAFIKMYCESKGGKITSAEEYDAVIELFFEHFVKVEGEKTSIIPIKIKEVTMEENKKRHECHLSDCDICYNAGKSEGRKEMLVELLNDAVELGGILPIRRLRALLKELEDEEE